MLTEDQFDKLKYHIMMIVNIRIGVIPSSPLQNQHPFVQKAFTDELKTYLKIATETQIKQDFNRYFKDETIISRMQNNKAYDYSGLLAGTNRPMYPTKTSSGPL
jgi:hypothetical protein